MPVASALMTVEEFRQLPESGDLHELRHGELIRMSRPKKKHWRIQDRVVDLLKPLAAGYGLAGMEFSFRPLPEHELWTADVAVVSRQRDEATDPDDNLHGAPEIVIEVLSPSNTAQEMNDRESICLENGCLEFWLIDPDRKWIKVSTPDRITRTYHSGERVPLPLLGAASLAVDDIFA